MAFHYPQAFFLLIPFALLCFLYGWSRVKRRNDIIRLGDWRLVKDLIPLNALERRKKKDLLALAGLLILIFACAGPQFGSNLKEVKHRGVDVFIAIDTSRSMLAEDIAPSRLEHAKRALGYLIQKLDGNRVGVIAFAKTAQLQCPLTVDTDAAKMFLDIIDEYTVPEQGTSIGDAIRLALKSIPKQDKAGRAVVLLTDGEDHRSDPIGAAKEAKEKGVVLFTIGIGTTKGEVIKKRDEEGKVTEFLKHNGEMVISRMDDALLTKIAELTGGRYYRASSTDREIDEIADILNGFDKQEFSARTYDRMRERYQIFALIALLILILEFFFAERGGQIGRVLAFLKTVPGLNRLAGLIFLAVLFMGAPAHADFKDHIRKGNRYMKKGDIPAARAEFESAQIDAPEAAFIPYNIATTYYLEGNFDEAKKKYEQAMAMTNDPDLKSKISYNLAHLLFSMGQREASLAQFKECLKLNPKDMDAKYNVEYIRSGKTPKNQMQPKKSDGNGDKDKKEQQKQDGQEKQDRQNAEQKEDDENRQSEKKQGSLSKEDAERILQMMKDQESEKLKEGKAKQLSKPGDKKKDDKDGAGEDW